MKDILDRIEHHTRTRPVDVERIISELGITLRKNAPLDPGIAGYIRWTEANGFEIATTEADHEHRQRFTMAHELGHYVLHRGLIGKGINDDTKYRSTSSNEFYNTAIDEFQERQANAFAAALLMPEALLRDDAGRVTVPDLRELARQYQVSPSAMRWRLKSLRLYEPKFAGQ